MSQDRTACKSHRPIHRAQVNSSATNIQPALKHDPSDALGGDDDLARRREHMRHRRRVHEREQHQDEIGNLSYPGIERAFPTVKYTNQKTESKNI